MSNAHTAKITIEAADNMMAVFAGQTVTAFGAVFAQMELVYALAGKRTGIRSYFALEAELERRGVTSSNEYPGDFASTKFHTFPAA
jgi:hypothetical protein